jgi:hypothetical protein
MPERTTVNHSGTRDARRSTRRAFLRRSGVATLAAGALVAGLPRTTYASTSSVYLDRQTWDAWHEEFYRSGDGLPDEPNDDTVRGKSGGLAWGQSYLMAGLLRMYNAYGDTRYLDRLIENIDLVLSMRDSEGGVIDYKGESLPAWRANHPYTVGAVALVDDQGRPTLEVRVGRVYSSTTSVTVRPGSEPDTFDLDVVHGQSGDRHIYAGLSMDPSSSNYAVRRLYDAYPATVLATARDLRPTPDAAGNPVPGTYQMTSLPTIFAVHTGMITYPMATFVRLVRETPR